MAEAAQGIEGDTDGNYQTEEETSNQNDFQICLNEISILEAIPEEQNQKDSLNGNHDPNANTDISVSSSQNFSVEPNDETSRSDNADGLAYLDNTDADSSDLTMTESSTISKSREEKIRYAREYHERERQRKIAEILEAQRQAEEFRQRQQEDRRRKIDEMRRKDQERRKTVEDRRRRMQEVEEERRASLLRRSQARESRIDTMRSSRMPGRMAMSCVLGAPGGSAAGDAALAALSRPRVAFGSGTPREILSSLTPSRGARSSSRGAGTSTDRSQATRRRPLSMGQARSASVTPSSSFVAEKPGQVEKALSGSATLPRRAGRSVDRHQTPTKSATSPDDASSNEATKTPSQTSAKLRSRSQGADRHHLSGRPRPMSQVVTPAEMDSVFARLAQPKQRTKATPSTTATPSQPEPKKTAASASKEKRAASTPASKKTPTPTPSGPPKATSGPIRRRLPSPPKKETSQTAAAGGKASPASTASPAPVEVTSSEELKTSDEVKTSEELKTTPPEETPAALGEASATEDDSEDFEEPEPVAFDQMPSIMTQSMPAAVFQAAQSTTKDITEDEYRLKIAEQRRLAREKLERERQEKEEARLARAAQERERQAQARRTAEEARRRMEEEEARQRQEEEKARLEEEERAKQRKEEERLALEAAEQERKQRLAREEEERLARKARLDKIMSRVKRGEDSSPTPTGAALAPSPAPNATATASSSQEELAQGLASGTVSPAPSTEAPPSEQPAVVASPAVPPTSLTTNGRCGPSPVGSSGGERDSPAGSVSPAERKSSSPPEAPKFKSALLQSMLAGGRLSHGETSFRRSSGSALSILQASLAGNASSQEEIGAPPKGGGGEASGGVSAAGGMPHSFSLDALSAAASHRDSPGGNSLDGDARSPASGAPLRSSVSNEEILDSPAAPSLPNGDNHNNHHHHHHHPYNAPAAPLLCDDMDEEVDGPALMSANIRTRLDEAKSAAAVRTDNLRENDNSRTAFEEILHLPHSTGHHDHHLDGPVDPVSGAWFEQPSAQKPREQTAISDLLS